MTASADIEGMDELDRRLKALDAAIAGGTRTGLQIGAELVRGEAVRLIQQGPKTGKVYQKGGRLLPRRTHQASAPGEPPASDTGDLVGKIHARRDESGDYEVGTKVTHGLYLELGTKTIAPRPWLFPALESKRSAVADQVTKQVAKRIEKITKG